MKFVTGGMKGLVPQSLLPVAALVISRGACTANKEPSKMETTLANTAQYVVIPIEAEKRVNPLPANADTLREGRSIYLQSYAICHGDDGHGHTELGLGMYPPAMA